MRDRIRGNTGISWHAPPSQDARGFRSRGTMQITDAQARIIGREIGDGLGTALKSAIFNATHVGGGVYSSQPDRLVDAVKSGFREIAAACKGSDVRG